MTLKYDVKELFDLYLAPKLLLNDGVIIRSDNSIIEKLPFISDLMKSKFKEGIDIDSTKNNIKLDIPLISLNISSDFIKLIKDPYLFEGGDIGLYQDYLIAKGYGYSLDIEDLFDLNKIDLESYFDNFDSEIQDLYNEYFKEIHKEDFLDFIDGSMELIKNKNKYRARWNSYALDFIKNTTDINSDIFNFIRYYKEYLDPIVKEKLMKRLTDIILSLVKSDSINSLYNLSIALSIKLKKEVKKILFTKLDNYIKTLKFNEEKTLSVFSKILKLVYIFSTYDIDFTDSLTIISNNFNLRTNAILVSLYILISSDTYKFNKRIAILIITKVLDLIHNIFDWDKFKKLKIRPLLESSLNNIKVFVKETKKIKLKNLILNLYNFNKDRFLNALENVVSRMIIKNNIYKFFNEYILDSIDKKDREYILSYIKR